MISDFYYLAVPSAICIVLALFYRSHLQTTRARKGSASLIFKDLVFDNYATIPLLSFIYSLILGALVGSSFGFVLLFFKYYQRATGGLPFLLYALICLIAVVAYRIILENVIVIFKTAEDASRYFRLQSQLLTSNYPELKNSAKQDSTPAGSIIYLPGHFSRGDVYLRLIDDMKGRSIDTSLLSSERMAKSDSKIEFKDEAGAIVATYVFVRRDSVRYLR